MSVAPAAQFGVYFHEFRPRAEENREGWGIAWWTDGHPHILKEPIPANESALAAELAEDPPVSEVFVVHVRAATIGNPTVENTHPFQATAVGREWVFAHNGTVQELSRLDTGRYEQVGDTDSERSFHHVLNRLEQLGTEASDSAIAAAVLSAGRELSERDSRVNFLLSDGRTLFAYHDGHKTLHVMEKRAADLGEMEMSDADYHVSLRLGDAPDEHAVIVASVPLTEESGWEKLEAGAFLVVRDGMVVDRLSPGAPIEELRARAS